MRLYLNRFYDFLARPLKPASRLALALRALPLAFSFTHPLWRISMEAPQYPNGLTMDIYAYTVEGGNNGQHIQEINTLNHYIGMRTLDREAMSDLDWIPFALGALFIFALRVAAIGNVSALLDLVVMTSYVSAFAFGRFVYTLYIFGHHLKPDAPVKVPGFMPAVLGSKQIANFTTHSWPQWGSYFLMVFVVGTMGVLLWHLVSGRRAAVREAAGCASSVASSRRLALPPRTPRVDRNAVHGRLPPKANWRAPPDRYSQQALQKARRAGFASQPAAQHHDRKSTRLNSSHLGISYAVFCLNKKKENRYGRRTTNHRSRR